MSKSRFNNDSQVPNTTVFALVSIHLPQDRVLSVPINKLETIHSQVDRAISFHGLNPRAKTFIVAKIEQSLSKVNPHKKKQTEVVQSQYVSGGSETVTVKTVKEADPVKGTDEESLSLESEKDSVFELKRVRKGDIDKNKINFQKIPELAAKQSNGWANKSTKKKLQKAGKKENAQGGSFLKEHTKARLATMAKWINPCCPITPAFPAVLEQFSQKQRRSLLSSKESEAGQNRRRDGPDVQSRVGRDQRLPHRLKTENSAMSFRQYNLEDLQNEMHEQILVLRLEKRVRNLQPELRAVFSSIKNHRLPSIDKIEPCLEGMSEELKACLLEFLQHLTEQESKNLDFPKFRAYLVKYRADKILHLLR